MCQHQRSIGCSLFLFQYTLPTEFNFNGGFVIIVRFYRKKSESKDPMGLVALNKNDENGNSTNVIKIGFGTKGGPNIWQVTILGKTIEVNFKWIIADLWTSNTFIIDFK